MGRTTEEIHQEMFAVVQVQSELTDSNDSAIANAMLKANAEQIEQAEDLIEVSLLKSLGLEAEGTELDDVVAQWKGFEPRREASPAQAAALEITRDGDVGTLDVPAGSVFGTLGGKRVVLTVGVTFQDGSDTYPTAGQSYGYVVSVQPGPAGNIDQGAVQQVIRAPDGVIGCRNIAALQNGQTRETDAQLRKRFLDYLAGGLTRLPEKGVIAVAKAFRDRGVRHASVWVDPSRPYAELIVDDGYGFVGLVSPARMVTGTIPLNGQLDFWFDAPVVESEVVLVVNDVAVTSVQWTTLHERGRALLDESAQVWDPGDTWKVYFHHVYGGVIAELQATIEGLLMWQGRDVGFRALAARIRVRTPTLEEIGYYVLVVYRGGLDQVGQDLVDAEIRATIQNFHLDLAQGQPLLMLRIKGQLDRIEGAENIHLRDSDDPSVEMQDAYPASPRHKLTVTAGGITINGV